MWPYLLCFVAAHEGPISTVAGDKVGKRYGVGQVKAGSIHAGCCGDGRRRLRCLHWLGPATMNPTSPPMEAELGPRVSVFCRLPLLAAGGFPRFAYILVCRARSRAGLVSGLEKLVQSLELAVDQRSRTVTWDKNVAPRLRDDARDTSYKYRLDPLLPSAARGHKTR